MGKCFMGPVGIKEEEEGRRTWISVMMEGQQILCSTYIKGDMMHPQPAGDEDAIVVYHVGKCFMGPVGIKKRRMLQEDLGFSDDEGQ